MASRVELSAQGSQGRAKSCTACRQVKLRCDAKEKFPAPCSRCVVKKSACRTDLNFKRTPVRRRLEEVTKELSRYQELLGQDAPSTTQVGASGRSNSDGQSSAPRAILPSGASVTSESSSSAQAMNVLMSGVCFCLDQDDLGQQPELFVLGDVYLDRHTVFELFNEFQNTLYPHFPVLDTSKSRAEMYEECSLLFWTVIITASKYSAAHSHLYTSLIPAYENLLAASIVKVTRSVSQLHAIMIIIMWPLPYPGPTHDPSWGYCGLAMNAALQMGMHRPGFHREYGFPDLTQEQVQLRTVTWMMAFQTSVCSSTFLGVPPFIDATPHMDAILANPQGLPRAIVAQTDIQLHVARFTRALDDTAEAAAKVMYINMFERDLERLRGTFESTWSNDVELNLTSAKLYLYAHIFVSRKRDTGAPSQRTRSLLEDPGSRRIIYAGLTASVGYIQSFDDLSRTTSSPASWDASPASTLPQTNRQMYYPHHYWRTLVLSSFYLLKILAFASDIPGSEQELARNHLTMSYNIFMGYTSKEHIGVANTIELLVNTSGIPVEGKVNTRLGASIIFDGLLVFSQLQKARSTGKLDRAEAETPVSESVDAVPGYEGIDSGFSIAEFLHTDWNLPWDTNFFDMGMEMRQR